MQLFIRILTLIVLTAAILPKLHHELNFSHPSAECPVWAMRFQHRISSCKRAAPSSGTRTFSSAFDLRELQDNNIFSLRRSRRQVRVNAASISLDYSTCIQLNFRFSIIFTPSGAEHATMFHN